MDEVIKELDRLATLPGLKLIDLAALPVAVPPPRRTTAGRAAAETEVPIVEDRAISGERVGTQPMPLSQPPILPVGGTKWLPAKSISTLSEAVGARSVVNLTKRPSGSGRGVALAVAVVAVGVGGFFFYRTQFADPVRPSRPGSADPIAVGSTSAVDVDVDVDDRRPKALGQPRLEERAPAVPPVEVAPADPPTVVDRATRPPGASAHRDVKIRISSSPSGAEIVDAATGARIGETPYNTLVRAERRTARYTVQKAGFKNHDVAVKFDDDATYDLVLRRKSSGSSTPTPPPTPTTTPAKPVRPTTPTDDGDDERRKL
jgi:hypothetical protein